MLKVAPIPDKSSVSASSEGQRANSALGVSSDMPDILGPIVLNVKADLSYDLEPAGGDTPVMADRMSESEEKAAFIGRVKEARMARFLTQKPICALLDLDQGTYKQYESRTPLPHRLIPKFVAATGVSYEWLLTGEGQGPIVLEHIRPERKQRRRPVRSKAA